MGLFERGARLVQLVDHLQQVRHAFRGPVVEPVSLLLVVDDETASGLVESATDLLVQDPRHKEGSTFLRVCVR